MYRTWHGRALEKAHIRGTTVAPLDNRTRPRIRRPTPPRVPVGSRRTHPPQAGKDGHECSEIVRKQLGGFARGWAVTRLENPEVAEPSPVDGGWRCRGRASVGEFELEKVLDLVMHTHTRTRIQMCIYV